MADWSDWASSLRGILGLPDPSPQSQGLLSDPYINTGAKTATVMGLLADRAAPKLAGVPGSVADAATLPGDVYLGKADMNTDQGLGRAINMVGFLAGGGMPMAESGSAGLFGGRLAANAEKQSGWFRSPVDNLERFEIPDNKAVYKEPLLQMKRPISDVLSHPEFYDAYPGLKNMLTVTRKEMPKDVGGEYDLMGNININKNLSPDEAKSVLLHEIQHAVQEKEGFARGSSPEYERQITGADQRDAYGFYHRTAGETEARNVQARQNYGILARQAWPPWVTQDVPWISQLRR